MTVDPRLIHPATAGPDRLAWVAIDAAERTVSAEAQRLAAGACPNPAHSPRFNGRWSCEDCTREAEAAREAAENAAAKAAARGQVTDQEWSTFLAAITKVAAANGGQVDQNKVRPLIRGRIEHKHIGTAYGIARRSGLLIEHGTNRSDDTEGKNAGRWQPLYLLRSAA